MWLNLFGPEAVQHKLKNRQKMHFLCFQAVLSLCWMCFLKMCPKFDGLRTFQNIRILLEIPGSTSFTQKLYDSQNFSSGMLHLIFSQWRTQSLINFVTLRCFTLRQMLVTFNTCLFENHCCTPWFNHKFTFPCHCYFFRTKVFSSFLLSVFLLHFLRKK